MGFTIEKKQFLKALQSVAPAVATRSSLPILSGVRLADTNTGFALEATNLEIVVRLQGQANSNGENKAAVVPAKSLTQAVKSIGADEITVDFPSEAEGGVEVSAGNRRITINGFPLKDWPELPDLEWQPICHVETKALAEALTRVTLCASTDEARPVLTGVQFNFDGEGGLELVATDSYRLGIIPLEVEMLKDAPKQSSLVPARALKALAKKLKGREGRTYILVSGSESVPRIEFAFEHIGWVMRTVDGDFPNWRQLVPDSQKGAVLHFSSDEFAAAVRDAAALRSQKSVPVRLELGDECRVEMTDVGAVAASQPIEGASYSPKGVGALTVAFNPQFITDGVALIGERGRMWITDPYKPALFEAEERRYVLMPVRLPS